MPAQPARYPPPTSTHADGTPCFEGSRLLPARFSPCCTAFQAATWRCVYDIRFEWWRRYRGWFMLIDPSAGGGGVRIRFCPFCGGRLAGVGRAGERRLDPEAFDDFEPDV